MLQALRVAIPLPRPIRTRRADPPLLPWLQEHLQQYPSPKAPQAHLSPDTNNAHKAARVRCNQSCTAGAPQESNTCNQLSFSCRTRDWNLNQNVTLNHKLARRRGNPQPQTVLPLEYTHATSLPGHILKPRIPNCKVVGRKGASSSTHTFSHNGTCKEGRRARATAAPALSQQPMTDNTDNSQPGMQRRMQTLIPPPLPGTSEGTRWSRCSGHRMTSWQSCRYTLAALACCSRWG
jgi:hypothetical protein